ncbi:DUF3108 domain-containing protein [Piscinibacter sp. HJYY11]|uniref:DUF3108 domain-containing protein n=1 Tax=Piscinibacter sp. HJYY11 TaxID=2801333 RepID=UPI00191FA7E7|nr:DUF3108 domain-containing protein [Piscinibacter sp. HJYY11]MBL0730218.1 DUF3108 domain-containing protein [Piscinibacter sp. HJYY11]
MAHRLTQRLAAPRAWAALGLLLLVSWAHVGVAGWMAEQAAAFDLSSPPEVQRIEVAYVREMPFTAPAPRAVAQAAPAQRRTPAPAPAAPEPAASAPLPAAEPASSPSSVVEVTAPEPAVVAAASAPELASSAPAAFEWPVSTRLRYLLTGHVRGEVHGQAQVEWIRAGPRYQVHLDVQVGPSFAPIASRRMSSEGEITPDGLLPHRYEQETRLAFDGPYRAIVRFDGSRVWMSNGNSMVQLPGVQDTASQFVQLAYLFDREPQRLRVGAVVEVVLAMPRNVSAWVYDVVKEELLHTPFGEVPSYHLKPRREPRVGGDLVTELWIAPQLRHLPIRFVIRQDAENYVDLMLDRRPELAAPDPSTRTPP